MYAKPFLGASKPVLLDKNLHVTPFRSLQKTKTGNGAENTGLGPAFETFQEGIPTFPHAPKVAKNYLL